MRLLKYSPIIGLKPISIFILGLLAMAALLFLTSGEVRGDPPLEGDWYVEGHESYSNTTLTVNGDLQINQTNSLSLYNVTLIFNNTEDQEFSLNIFGTIYVNSSTINSSNPNFRMGDTDIDGTMECRDSTLRDFADFRLEEGADFFANNTVFSNGRRLFVTAKDLGTVVLENSTIGSTLNPSNIIINDRVIFRETDFPDDEVSIGEEGELVVQHFLSIFVNDSSGEIMEGADIDIESFFTDLSFVTDGNGWVRNVPLTEYTKTSSKTTYDENFTITVSHTGYFDKDIDVRMNRTQTITFTLTPLPDPYVEEDDITIPLKPNEGDIMNINVSVHNIGEDASVRVHIYLEDSKDKRTHLKTENLVLEDGITRYVETTWNTTQKKVGLYSIVVEIENRTADRNVTNNTAEKEFQLYARPIVTSVTTNVTDVLRLDSVSIGVEGEDIETAEENLTLKIQAQPSLGGLWDSSYFSAPYWNGSTWVTNFTPPGGAELGDYDLRFRFTDENDGASNYYYRQKLIFVMNNPPVISDTIPDAEIQEDNDLVLDLTDYEDDREDGAARLTWHVQSYNKDAIFSIQGQNSTDDVLTFIPWTNWTGNTTVLLILSDKDGSMDSQYIHIHWSSVNDAPILEDVSFSAMQVLRTFPMVITINSTDDNTTEEDLKLSFQLQLEGDIGWTDVNFGIVTRFMDTVDEYWETSITPSMDVEVGNYTLRFNMTDDNTTDPGMSPYHYYSIKVLNNPPDILDITPSSDMLLRTDTMVFTVNASDVEDNEEDLQPTVEFKYKKYAFNTLAGIWYDAAAGAWSFNFTPSTGAGLGNYTFRAMFSDLDGGSSDWMETTIVVVNNPPEVINLTIPATVLSVNNTFYAYANGTDVEDMESKLIPMLELRAEDGDAVWFSDYVVSAEFVVDTWVFTIHLPEDADIGDFSFRLYFTDKDGDVSLFHIETDSLRVINNVPIVLNMGIPQTVARTDEAILYANAKCDLDEEDALDVRFEYYHKGQWWDNVTSNTFLGDADYAFQRWEIEFLPDEQDSSMGNYSFRVMFKLRESAWSPWFYLQNGTEVVNSIPKVTALELNATEVYRGDSITVTIAMDDAEDDIDQLNISLEYSLDGNLWQTAYLSPPTLSNGLYESTFLPPYPATLGNYTFRARGSDTEGENSSWFLNETVVWVMNNPPVVVVAGDFIPETKDNEDNPLTLDLTKYESDKEDPSIDLDWEVVDYDMNVIIKIDLEPNYDYFTFTPAENFWGSTTVRFKLIDSDGGSDFVNGTLTWTSVNDEPVITDAWTDQTILMRNTTLTVYIQAHDDDDIDSDLTPFIHYMTGGGNWINASVSKEMLGGLDDGTIIVNHTIPTTVPPGNYSIRVKVMDTSGNNRTQNSTWYSLPGTVEFVNHLPFILDIFVLEENAKRTDIIPIYVDAVDHEDDIENLSLELAYSYDLNETSGEGNWTIGYSGNVYYDDIFEYLIIEFIPPVDAPLGKIYLKARVIDGDAGRSLEWSDVVNLTISNNGPVLGTIPLFSIKEDTVLVVNLTACGSDTEDDPSDLRWFVDSYNASIITNLSGNGTVELRFTPRENFTGSTIITVNLTDRDGAFITTSVTLQWTIVYEAPRIIGYVLEETFVYRTTNLDIVVEVEDDDDPEGTLKGTLEYLPPVGDWNALSITYVDGEWIAPFMPGSDWVTGVYLFKVKFQDSDELESPWLWINITVLSTPKVESFSGPSEVYRTHTVTFYANASDANDDDEWELTPHFGYSRSNITYSSGSFGTPYYDNGMFIVNFTPPAGLIIDQYYIRIRFNDTDGAYSAWKIILITIRNNAPMIVGTILDAGATEDQSIILNLEAYGSDDEDPAEELNWTADWSNGIQEVKGNSTRDLEIVPALDFTGNAIVLLTLRDADGATVSQSVTLTWNPVNDAPRLSYLELKSDTTDLIGSYIFHTGSNLTAVLHDPFDAEGDPFTVWYSWIVNGNYVVENSTTANNLTSDNFQLGDVLTLRIILSDATDSRQYENGTTIRNAPPSIDGVDIVILYLGVETTRANESTTLRATPYGYFDLDGEPADENNFTYEWYNKGILIVSGLNLFEIDGTHFSKDFNVYCRVLPYDGKDYGIGDRSSTIRIFNTPPTLKDITIGYTGGEPFGPNEHSTLSLDLSGYADLDNDPSVPSTFEYSWFVNGIEIGRTTRTLESLYFVKGDQVHCVVTPYDGSEYGLAVESESMTIRNTPPTIIDASLNFTGPRPDKHSSLSIDMTGFDDRDGDPPDLFNFAYEWMVNGNPVGTDPTFDLAPYDRGDVVRCVVTPYDGTDFGAPVTTKPLTILNTPPSFSGSDIVITYQGKVVTIANLSCVLTASGENYADLDNDPEQQSRYSWYIDDLFVKSGKTIDGSYIHKGDRVYCMVEPYDGTYYGPAVKSEEITIDNTAPEVDSIRVYAIGNNPTRVATFTAQIIDFYDEDNDPQGVHGYVWYVNGVEVIGQTNSTLKNSMTDTFFTKGDAITVRVTPYDGTDYGTPVLSFNQVVIINTAPILEDAKIEWTGEHLNATSTLSVNTTGYYSDPDGDLFKFFYYSWYKNSNLIITKYNDNTLAGVFFSGDRLFCEVTPNDGEDNGSSVNTPNIQIKDSPPEIYGSAGLESDSYPVNENSIISLDTGGLRTVDIDGDRTTFLFKWDVNGIPAGAPEVNGLSGIYFDKGDIVRCRIYSHDGTLISGKHIVSSSIVVGNTRPTAVIIRPYQNTFGNVHETLRLDGTGSFDLDAVDTGSLTYRWLVDGEEVAQGAITSTSLTPGDHVVTLEVTDSDDLSDTADVNVHIRASDLMINEERITISGTQYVDKSISFLVNIGNIGDGSAQNIDVGFYVDNVLIGSVLNISLKSNNNETVSMIWKAKEGIHTVKVIVDTGDANLELKEDNNEAQRTFEITLAPEEEETIFGIQELYVYIIAGLIVAVIVLGLLDIITWNRTPKKSRTKSGTDKDTPAKDGT